MLKTITQAGQAAWSDFIFIVVIHLLLLSLYAFVYHLSTTGRSQYPRVNVIEKPQYFHTTNTTVLGVYI